MLTSFIGFNFKYLLGKEWWWRLGGDIWDKIGDKWSADRDRRVVLLIVLGS